MLTSLLPAAVTLPSWGGGLAVLLAKATIILVAAIALTGQMHRASAGARHLVWLVTLGTLLVVPALTAWAPIEIRILPARATRTHMAPSQTLPEPQRTDNAVTQAVQPAMNMPAATTPAVVPPSASVAAPATTPAARDDRNHLARMDDLARSPHLGRDRTGHRQRTRMVRSRRTTHRAARVTTR